MYICIHTHAHTFIYCFYSSLYLWFPPVLEYYLHRWGLLLFIFLFLLSTIMSGTMSALDVGWINKWLDGWVSKSVSIAHLGGYLWWWWGQDLIYLKRNNSQYIRMILYNNLSWGWSIVGFQKKSLSFSFPIM